MSHEFTREGCEAGELVKALTSQIYKFGLI